jgi:tol-pal system protein YbgF
MAVLMSKLPRGTATTLFCLVAAGFVPAARAGLFDDDEARKAILDLRQRLEQSSQKIEQSNERQRALQAEQIARLADQITQNNTQSAEQIATLKRSLLDLNSQLELLRADIAKLRGQDEQRARDSEQLKGSTEQLARSVAELQRKQKDITEGVEDRIRKIEPQKVTVDDKEFLADPEEKRLYDDAMAALRKGEFEKAAPALSAFQRRFPASGYTESVQFWLGNALYLKRDYKESIASFRAFVSAAPNSPRAPEALLAVANCEVEMKDTKAARKTIGELVKAYPKSEAAQAGRDRLATLK